MWELCNNTTGPREFRELIFSLYSSPWKQIFITNFLYTSFNILDYIITNKFIYISKRNNCIQNSMDLPCYGRISREVYFKIETDEEHFAELHFSCLRRLQVPSNRIVNYYTVINNYINTRVR